ncbi:MAG TPA: hypothetical protein VGS79_17590 [Puia sp.]|nr:hypothetical protein [Puia sp.]
MKLTNRLFPRSFLRAFHLIPPESAAQPLTPYFQYKIGAYQKDHFLYFRREPSWLRYKVEAFDKMIAMRGYDIPRFLDFHYAAYADKEDFRRFLRYEIEGRLAHIKKYPKDSVPAYPVILKWLAEKEAPDTAKTSALSATDGQDAVSEQFQQSLAELARSYAGNIVIRDPRQSERLIQLLILLKDLRAPGKTGETLFTDFSTTDLAAILRQIAELRDYKLNTLQKKISGCNQAMRDDARVTALQEALTRYFFGQ